MRLSSTSFTHGSTAVFACAVVGYAAVRVVTHGAPQLPGHDAAPVAPPVQQVRTAPGPAGRSSLVVDRSARGAEDGAHAVAAAPARSSVVDRSAGRRSTDRSAEPNQAEAVEQDDDDRAVDVRADDSAAADDSEVEDSEAGLTDASTDDDTAGDPDDD